MRDIFLALARRYSGDNTLILKCWFEIERAYSQKNRVYHTLIHLEEMFSHLLPLQEKCEDFDIILFATFYHDIIYNAQQNDNENKSADLAKIRLCALGVPAMEITKVESLIIATKTHKASAKQEVAWFLDADMAILGSDSQKYDAYAKAIRHEYSCYEDAVYYPKRREVLEQFLDFERIFSSMYFYEIFEIRARQNLKREIQFCESVYP